MDRVALARRGILSFGKFGVTIDQLPRNASSVVSFHGFPSLGVDHGSLGNVVPPRSRASNAWLFGAVNQLIHEQNMNVSDLLSEAKKCISSQNIHIT